jgi:hypothetical protein
MANLLQQLGIEVFVAEWYLAPGAPLDHKIFSQIKMADCIVVLLTRNGIRSNWVQQEIGYALELPKPVIPLVEKGVDPKDLAALQGKEYIEYDPMEPQQALLRLSNYVKALNLKKAERQKTLIIAGGVAALLLLLLSGGERS